MGFSVIEYLLCMQYKFRVVPFILDIGPTEAAIFVSERFLELRDSPLRNMEHWQVTLCHLHFQKGMSITLTCLTLSLFNIIDITKEVVFMHSA